jgi:hypothetical protein|tara:strand:+ start:13590 stop:13766 length:177 start_codon:yes stop_codon:yes gene_type:complete
MIRIVVIRIIVGVILLLAASGVKEDVDLWVMIAMGLAGAVFVLWGYISNYLKGELNDY